MIKLVLNKITCVSVVSCLERFTSGGEETDSEITHPPMFQVLDKKGLKKEVAEEMNT
jgi:hypothetical protein